jgi:hypothetical protein
MPEDTLGSPSPTVAVLSQPATISFGRLAWPRIVCKLRRPGLPLCTTDALGYMQVVLVALPGVDLEAVQGEVDRQCDALPRGDTARQALAHSAIVRVDSRVRIRAGALHGALAPHGAFFEARQNGSATAAVVLHYHMQGSARFSGVQ